MAPQQPQDREPGLVELAVGDGALRRSVLTALVVGAILTAINQGDVVLAGQAPSWIKIALNFVVPYCVATLGAVSAKRAARRLRAGARAGRD